MATRCGLLESDCFFNGLPLEGKCGLCVPDSPAVKDALIRRSGLVGGYYIATTADLSEASLVGPDDKILFIVTRGNARKLPRPVAIGDYYDMSSHSE